MKETQTTEKRSRKLTPTAKAVIIVSVSFVILLAIDVIAMIFMNMSYDGLFCTGVEYRHSGRSSDYFGYKFYQAMQDRDEVSVTICFGTDLKEYLYEHFYGHDDKPIAKLDIAEFDVYFADENNQMILPIRHSNEDYVSEEYDADGYHRIGLSNNGLPMREGIPKDVYDWRLNSPWAIYFSHEEEVVIPRELFDKKQGEIRICVSGKDSNQKEVLLIGGRINYLTESHDKVKLFTNENPI